MKRQHAYPLPLATIVAFVVVALFTCLTQLTEAFHACNNILNIPSRRLLLPSKIQRATSRQQQPLRAGIGDVFSSLTGTPPTSLDPPLELLTGTSIDPAKPNVDLVRCYKASVDGWSAIDFHNCVDGRGSCLVVALSTKSNKRFGGYNPLGWMSTDDYGSSNAAFLWFEGSGSSVTPLKVPVLSGGGACIFDYATSGPCFGASDLVIGPPQAGESCD